MIICQGLSPGLPVCKNCLSHEIVSFHLGVSKLLLLTVCHSRYFDQVPIGDLQYVCLYVCMCDLHAYLRLFICMYVHCM